MKMRSFCLSNPELREFRGDRVEGMAARITGLRDRFPHSKRLSRRLSVRELQGH